MAIKTKQEQRKVRHYRIRKTVIGTAAKPRLNVFKSTTNFYAQLINDETGTVVVSSSTLELKLGSKNIEAAKKVGQDIAKKAIKAGVKEVVFDRAGYLYHGKIKAFADAAREAGLKF